MKQILLTQGKFALVDNRDYWLVRQFKWGVAKDGNKWYAVTHTPRDKYGKQKTIKMHRLLAGFPPFALDHKNGDGLNNRRGNLRPATNSENQANRGVPITNTSGYKGVHWSAKDKQWKAAIRVCGSRYYLGYFTNKIAAFGAYYMAAQLYFDQFAIAA